MRKFTIQLQKGAIFKKSPTELVLNRLVKRGIMTKADDYQAHYDSNHGRITIKVNENQVNLSRCKTEARKLELDDMELRS